jgi:hypothetical protein
VRRALLLLIAVAVIGSAADDPYAPWMQGRPLEAVALLHARAADAGSDWTAWYDCALAAEAGGERGRGAAWLLEAHRLAPERREPLRALRDAGAPLGATWCERIGPLAWLGSGWRGVAVLGLSGLSLGWWLGRRGGTATAFAGFVFLAIGAPGAVAAWRDAHEPLLAVVHETSLLDSTGAAIGDVPAGAIGWRAPQPPWSGRVLVTLPDGRRGYVSLADAGFDAAERF